MRPPPRSLWRLSPLDRRLALRTAALTSLLTGIALLVLARTDEPGSTWSDRLLRLAALTPALASVAASLLVRQMGARGEALALALTGAPPLRCFFGVALGGALIGVPASLLGVTLAPSLRALLPVVTTSPWVAAPGGFLAPSLGLQLARPGAEVVFQEATTALPPAPERWPIALALALASWVAPWWAALPCAPLPRLAVGICAVLGAITAFHAVALGASGLWLLSPCVLLVLHGLRLT
ncbi:MAG: hypothetical protein RMJ98_12475 [Myxococcales bacterium]|nr:hypothetical protein [Polyangiaceae bacterium]MDW8250102.1 hypothetical protein [Myxococcales bacterium]